MNKEEQRAPLLSDGRVISAYDVRRVLLEIRNGAFYHHNGVGNYKAVYLLNIENAFARIGVSQKKKEAKIIP